MSMSQDRSVIAVLERTDACGVGALDYLDSSNRRMCSLFLDLMDWGGLTVDRFGDSSERLVGI